MIDLLEITGDDIAKLEDGDLRNLIGLLCEADYRCSGLSTRGITWGGNQDAPDGGLDVVVRHEFPPPQKSFIPNKLTGFQVKKTDMPASSIGKEMRPDGKLREEIKSLIKNKGAYIIVSSGGSTSETALQNRTAAMKNAIAKDDKSNNLVVEFMDRGKIASWVRHHPSYILWVRSKIGKPIQGWQPYGNWSNAPGGVEEEYLIDDRLRLHNGVSEIEAAVSVEDGILNLRQSLKGPGNSLRLTGLSGTGKTRLVQALFDQRIGQATLNASSVIYTDISDSPLPDPTAMAAQLISENIPAILIVDNCPPDLHRRIAKICARPSSSISLLSIEYDVRDDLPEETNVFRLEPASEGIIEELIKRRYPHISNVDARSIAEFAGGNSRVAIALANTLEKGETLSSLKDEELFERLFRQRHDSSSDLLISAEVCSLVYSFEGVDVDSENSELKILSSLINKEITTLYRDVSTLKLRDLVQSRDVWRAVLPHAIANRLAKRALESIPTKILLTTFQSAPVRLQKSFTHRLGHIHDSRVAVEITDEWLGKDGLLGQAQGKFDYHGISMFRDLAPVSPKAALELIENAANEANGTEFTSRKNIYYYEFVRILKNLAYDPELFLRSSKLICRFALAEKPDERTNSTRNVLKSLFYLYLSGTHAPIEQRIKIIEELVNSSRQDEADLGILLLGAALKAQSFTSSGHFKFGARSRNYGFVPSTYEDIKKWYGTGIHLAYRLALSKGHISERVRSTLASKLPGLISQMGILDEVDEYIREIHADRPWQDGWFAIKRLFKSDKGKMEVTMLNRLIELENYLRPKDISELALAYTTAQHYELYSLEDDDENLTTSKDWISEKTIELGSQLAQNQNSLALILPKILSSESTNVYYFGKGLAKGCPDRPMLWELLRNQFEKIPNEKRRFDLILGFLNCCSSIDIEFYDAILDHILEEDLFLGQWFPRFQLSSDLDEKGIERLKNSLDKGTSKIDTYRYLGYGGIHKNINDSDLACILRKILSKEGGSEVVIEILHMRFCKTKEEEEENHSSELVKISFNVLGNHYFQFGQNSIFEIDIAMSEIASICLSLKYGHSSSDSICKNLSQTIAEYRVDPRNIYRTLLKLAKLQPFIFLDNFIGEKAPEPNYSLKSILSGEDENSKNPLNKISENDLLSWVEVDSKRRCSIISSVTAVFRINTKKDELEWKPFIHKLFEMAPNLDPVLKNLKAKIYPSSWSGSCADILEKRRILFSSLFDHGNEKIRQWARKSHTELEDSILRYRESERLRSNRRNERFE